MKRSNGWTLRVHRGLLDQIARLKESSLRAQSKDPSTFQHHPDFKLMRALEYLMFEVIPQDPANPNYRLGHTLGAGFAHWRRAKIGRRFRLFFRFDSRSKLIIYAWINDRHGLRSAGGQRDSYRVFAAMLKRGHPPDDWVSLVKSSQEND